jgi:hypothetical protein
MPNDITLSLMIGPAVPIPVSREVLGALTNVQVTTTEQLSVFQLTFTLSTKSTLHTLFLFASGASIPLVRVVLAVTLKGSTEVLIDGVMTNHQIQPGQDAGHSTLVVTGEDLSKVMDYIDFSGIPYPAMPREARVALVVAKYAMFGIIPLVIPSIMIDVPLPTERIFRHKGKDLSYVKKLADEVGYVFYMEPGPTPGTSFAYWGPQIKVGVPQPALNTNMDAHTNVESVQFTFEPSKKKLPLVMIQLESTKTPLAIPVPDITPLNPPLGLIPPLLMETKRIIETAKLTPLRGAMIGLAKGAKWSDSVFGSGTLDVLRYGRVLKARRLVGVRGVGTAFDGLYYVSSVTHKIKRGEYKQDFKLSRNGLVSTLSRVPA